ncbi:MAG: small multi-drug export protein [Candidatus Kerfeldbacteria bacterium]
MLGIDPVEIFQNIPEQLAVIVIAMLPIFELRGAIPAGIGGYDMAWWTVALLAVVGNMIPVFFILLFIEPVSDFLRKHSALMEKFFSWLFERTRRKFYKKHARWGDLALILFVAIPLPVTGAWTGSLAAWLFGIPFKKALPLIFIGVIIAATIVTALSLGIFSFI